MDKAEGTALFEKKLGAREDSDKNSIADLVEALEKMPLAVVQAAAYISQRRPRYSLVQYLAEFRRSDREKTILLDYEAGQLRRDREAKNSIIITWQISFEHLQQTQPSAADLLSLMSFFDRQGIPESLIHQGQNTNRASSHSIRQGKSLAQRLKHLLRLTSSNPMAQQDELQSNSREDRFEDDVIALRSLCFVSIAEDGVTFEMHSLVQLATRKWLAGSGKLEWWKQQFISNLCAAFPTGEYENWPTCLALFAHTKSAMEQRPEEESSLLEWARLPYRASWHACKKGNAVEAKTLALQSMEAREKILGREHENTLSSMHMAACACILGGQFEIAEELQEKVTEISKKRLGTSHGLTLVSMAHLAITYSDQGRWCAAEKLQIQVMETRKTKLGADHPDTLNSMSNLVSIYLYQGRWDDAEMLGLQVIETSKTKFGADHPYTLTSMANLAATYSGQGRWDEAGTLAVQVIETRKTKLGVNHPDTLTSMHNLAFTYKEQGRTVDAIGLMSQCLQQRQRVLKANHPDIQSSLAALEQWQAEQVSASIS